MRCASLLLVVVFFSVCTFVRNAPVQAGENLAAPHAPSSPFFGAGPVPKSGIITGAPYSAEGQSQNIQTLQDGRQIASPVLTWKFFRDSQGRTRVERPVATNNGAAPHTIIEITDPILLKELTMDSATKIVHIQPLNALNPILDVPPPAASQSEQHQTSEDLGIKIFEGVPCEGTRNTVLWPVGSAGNDRPFSVVTETWTAKGLQLVFLHKLDDPRTGVWTQKLINFSRKEPAAALFPGAPNLSPPRLISKADPKYTKEAFKAKLSGRVSLSLTVDEKGLPRDIKVVRSLGMGLDEEAIKALRKWRFYPGQKDGKPVPMQAQVEVGFQLLEQPPPE